MFVRVLCFVVVLFLAFTAPPARAGNLAHFWKTNDSADRFDMVILPCEAFTEIVDDLTDIHSAAAFELAARIYIAGFTMGHAHGREVVGKTFVDSDFSAERVNGVITYCTEHPKAAVIDGIRWSVDQDPITGAADGKW